LQSFKNITGVVEVGVVILSAAKNPRILFGAPQIKSSAKNASAETFTNICRQRADDTKAASN
jgi:hypothetical protein